MAEIGETAGVRGLWRKVTGQAAKEQAARQTRENELQKAQEAERRRAASLEARKKSIEIATRVKRTPLPDLDTDQVQDVVRGIESRVTGRSINGKFPPEVRMKDRALHPAGLREEYREYGDKSAFMQNVRWGGSLLRDFLGTLEERASIYVPRGFQDLAKKHFLMVVNVPNTEDAIISYQFLQNLRDAFGRSAAVVAMNFRLDREHAYKLFDLVRIEPEASEMFLQTAAEGFEAGSSSSPTAGIARVRSEEVVVVNLDRFNPNCFCLSNPAPRIAQEMVQNKNGQLEIYKYSAPHGVADPGSIPT